MDDRDEWLEGVRRWFYGGTEPVDREPTDAAAPGRLAPDAATPPAAPMRARHHEPLTTPPLR